MDILGIKRFGWENNLKLLGQKKIANKNPLSFVYPSWFVNVKSNYQKEVNHERFSGFRNLAGISPSPLRCRCVWIDKKCCWKNVDSVIFKLLSWFEVAYFFWSSLIHKIIVRGVQAVLDPREHCYLVGDVAALFIAVSLCRMVEGELSFDIKNPYGLQGHTNLIRRFFPFIPQFTKFCYRNVIWRWPYL